MTARLAGSGVGDGVSVGDSVAVGDGLAVDVAVVVGSTVGVGGATVEVGDGGTAVTACAENPSIAGF
jgi:hypothetical protein